MYPYFCLLDNCPPVTGKAMKVNHQEEDHLYNLEGSFDVVGSVKVLDDFVQPQNSAHLEYAKQLNPRIASTFPQACFIFSVRFSHTEKLSKWYCGKNINDESTLNVYFCYFIRAPFFLSFHINIDSPEANKDVK